MEEKKAGGWIPGRLVLVGVVSGPAPPGIRGAGALRSSSTEVV
jgi:hypothetical protein